MQLHSPRNCRISIKFLEKKLATKTFQILAKAYGDKNFPAYVFEWYKRFSGGRVSVEDDEPAERPRLNITKTLILVGSHSY
ncbi:hypothetical protein TNCV_2860431 [Trichonephila clavipes]|nr:hypothetical protein TNCV_2860431 [Trichonephila clavipes]